MNYPHEIKIKVNNIFGDKEVKITLNSGVTTFVGTNASGKTQTLKEIRNKLKSTIGDDKVRYLSSNRIGTMEQYRSQTSPYFYDINDYSVGDQRGKISRHKIEIANGDFFTMDDRKDVFIKVSERLSVLFNRQIYIRWDAGNMKVYFGKIGSNKEYSVVVEASGLVNIISILAAIFDETIEVLLIDEPEVSLHPQLQSYLLREIKSATEKYNKTIIIATHSAEMIELHEAEDLCNFVFFSEKELPRQIAVDAEVLKSEKLKDFILRMSLIYHKGFFAKKVMLIEGASDLIVCRYLNNRFNLNLDVAGSQIIPVDGKGQFPVTAKLFKLIGKDVCLLTDLDGFTDDNSVVDIFSSLPNSRIVANKHACDNLQEMIRNLKTKIDNIIHTNMEKMTAIYESHPYWLHHNSNDNVDKIIRRALIAKLFSESDNNLLDWPNTDEWISIKTRITALFEILEDLGCFVLRKGAIESYYIFSSNTTYDGKPSAAATEISGLATKTDAEVQEQYADIINALKYAALDKTVDENFAVEKELLTELPLVLGILDMVSSETDLLTNIKQHKGNNESLFSYRIIHENNHNGVEVSLQSEIIDVDGFPFKAFVGDNVNQIVKDNIRIKNDYKEY